jgi:pimeloyl-ACP methyl ester carboxylesterase
MKARGGIRLGVGAALCVAGFVLAKGTGYRETTVAFDAGGCHLVTDIIDKGEDETQGSVVLLHGLSANKKIMEHLAQGFAEEKLRVFVPDLPGHGRTAGPFSFARAERCGESLVRELIARRVIDPQRTILAGHSMGGAIAIRVAARVGVGGVIAISPAPMRVAHGVPGDMLPYTNPPPLPPHTLAISAALEPLGIRELTRDLVSGDATATSQYLFIPRATHVSELFDGRVARAAQDWAAKTLALPSQASGPSSVPLIGSVLGLAGILLLAGPFLRETLGRNRRPAAPEREMEFARHLTRAQRWALRLGLGIGVAADDPLVGTLMAAKTLNESKDSGDTKEGLSIFRSLMEVALVSLFAVLVLRYWNPLSFVALYSGGYFASFLLMVGLALLLLHRKAVRALAPVRIATVLLAAFAGLVLHLLVTAWFDATFTESWVSAARWARFPALFVAALAYLLAEELLLGPSGTRSAWMRLVIALALRFTAFLVLVFGIFVLHSGAILLLLLAVFLALFFVFQRMGMDLVRRETGSALAAAVFGAILLAGFCLVIFPVT